MDFHFFELFRRQLARLVDDLFRHRQFSDVMQQGGRPQRLDLAFRQIQFCGHCDGIGAHALQMGVRGVVFGLDGERQRFDRPHVQRRDLFDVALFYFNALFFRLQPAQIQPVRSIHPIDQGQNQKRGFPSRRAVHDSDSPTAAAPTR